MTISLMTACNMTLFKPWSVVTVPFPFTDKSYTKKRPALVLSQTSFQQLTNHLTLCMITSAKRSTWSQDITIANLESSGLPSPSIVRPKIFTLDASLVLGEIGELDRFDCTEVTKSLKDMFAFNLL